MCLPTHQPGFVPENHCGWTLPHLIYKRGGKKFGIRQSWPTSHWYPTRLSGNRAWNAANLQKWCLTSSDKCQASVLSGRRWSTS